MKKKLIETAEKPTRIEIINSYISGAKPGLETAQRAINYPIASNVANAQSFYEQWTYGVYSFLESFDKKRADTFIGEQDGVRTALNLMPQRTGNVVPDFVFLRNEKGESFSDHNGVRMLQDMSLSYKEKVSFLKRLKLEITGGILSDKDTKRVTIIIHESGKIKTSIDDQEVKRRRESVIMGVIYKIREMKGVKLASLSKDLRASDSNISRDIKALNDEIIEKWDLKEKVIVNESGYRMNKDTYNFYYDDL